MINAQPTVKQIANFWGAITITGRNMENAIIMKNTPEASKMPKYKRDFPEGTLLVADWKFPGRSLTPFDTTLKVPETLSLAVLTAASRSNPNPEEDSTSSESLEAA